MGLSIAEWWFPGPLRFLFGRFGMKSLARKVLKFMKREDGPTAVEYAVMLALIVVVCIAAITAIGGASNQTFSRVGSAIKPS